MKKFLGFKNTLILNFVLVGLLPLIGVAVVTLHVVTESLEKEIIQKNALLAKSLSGEIGAFIHEPKDILRQLGTMIEGGALTDRELFNASLESVLSNYPVFEMIEVLGPEGRVVAVAPFRRDYMGLDMSGKRFFRQIQKDRDVYWSSVFISQYTGEPTLIICLPLNQAALVGTLNLRVLSRFVDRLQQDAMEIGVVDNKGTYIASSVRSSVYEQVNIRTQQGVQRALSGIGGSYRVMHRDQEALVSVSLVPETGWPVVVYEKVSEAFAPVAHVQHVFWIGILVAGALAVATALVRVKRTLTPLSRLMMDAKRVTQGTYDIKPQPETYPEIDELSDNFRIMARAIHAREQSLRDTEKATQALLELVPDMIIRFNQKGVYTFFKPPTGFTSRLPPDAGAVVGKPMTDLMPEEVVSQRMALISRELETKGVVRHEYPIRVGDRACYREALYVSFGEDEYLGIVRDITGRRSTEAALRESEAKYRTILENMEEGYYEVDLAGTLTFFNDAFCRIANLPRHRLRGMNFESFMDRANATRVRKRFNQVYETGEPARHIELETLREDGTIRHVEVSAYLVRDGADRTVGFRGVIRDVSERKQAEAEKRKLESQLHQAQKLEALGTLAGGIAHDFNNLLMGIQGRISLMGMDKAAAHPDQEHLQGIETYIKNATALTRQLLGFARGGKYEVKPTNLNDLIQTNAALFGRTKKEIAIHTQFQEGIWTVAADQGQLDQVLMNLYINAWQAMPGGGDLYIETQNIPLEEKDVSAFSIEPGRYVRISVTDTGIGMDQDTLEKIFDPFFTTKEKGRGSGLGLASAYGIIRNHGGIINAYSEQGQGTAFRIYLPACEAEVAQEEMAHEEIQPGTETVLLVDDEPMILEIGEQLLVRLDYQVLTAGSGAEALNVYAENRDRIDLVILDMVMPGMTGGETFDRLKQINPRVKTILSSGYSINGQATRILDRGCSGFIQKPFNITALSRKIREILDMA